MKKIFALLLALLAPAAYADAPSQQILVLCGSSVVADTILPAGAPVVILSIDPQKLPGQVQPAPAQTVAESQPARPAVQRGTQRCEGRTKKGAQCKRNAQPGSRYCWQHQ